MTLVWSYDRSKPYLEVTCPTVLLDEDRMIGHLAHVAVASEGKVIDPDTGVLSELGNGTIVGLMQWSVLDAGLDIAFYWRESGEAIHCTEEWLNEIEAWATRQVKRLIKEESERGAW